MKAVDFNPASKIKGHRILFRPEVDLKRSVAGGISLKRIGENNNN